ncbi:tRNA pseudouridine13 synthase [Pseudidiomarina planktonica]|uniref:tRNA pseudouridine synthase D n=1 Tax=Pseudidiomarina planktonica TaxID=1323738 RepID=A0A1Y6EPU3_9GAMM|nr:tRNA pseudouridine(13) synthase TruD [Pseudidiomarina planktonica]RUO65508.1 tRNA pseudouridine(13) synthase TruD [Pseudidiomarina planktonica]SMQ64698.1 tRNA pseudouridine13 synthase [Pseudidiomarina planktonica]
MTELKEETAAGAPEWAFLHGKPAVSAQFKLQPEDFQVTEDFSPAPDEPGEHQWLWVEKRGANTRYVADQLAAFAGVQERDVGFAGMKDRQAVTRQWFSIQLPGKDMLDWQALEHQEFRVLETRRQSRKLKTGSHKGNHFSICLRDVSDMAALQQRFEKLCSSGVPNYFGDQRFGHGYRNISDAQRWFQAGRKRRVSRHKQGLLLSAARSFIFNQVVSERVAQQRLAAEAGDVMQLAGSRSFFVASELDETLLERFNSGDIRLTAPLWGVGEPPSEGAVHQLELSCAQAHPILAQGLQQHGLKQERRALLLGLEQASLTPDEANPNNCWLSFYLPTGCFATSIIRELITIVDYQNDENSAE